MNSSSNVMFVWITSTHNYIKNCQLSIVDGDLSFLWKFCKKNYNTC